MLICAMRETEMQRCHFSPKHASRQVGFEGVNQIRQTCVDLLSYQSDFDLKENVFGNEDVFGRILQTGNTV